ncbi:hypothetical protein GQ457_02G034710 [Hibiscus cannabinus]
MQLVKSILFGIANFWCRQLVLPKEILKKIEQPCSHFFSGNGEISLLLKLDELKYKMFVEATIISYLVFRFSN